jgi:hypothetical protein
VLAAVRDERGLGVVEDILRGDIVYTFRGRCEKCGHETTNLADIDLAKLVPSPDTRLRAAEITFKHTLPAEKIIRLEGFPGVQRAFDLMKSRIRFTSRRRWPSERLRTFTSTWRDYERTRDTSRGVAPFRPGGRRARTDTRRRYGERA